jgi:hypothetical protein
MSYQDEEFGDEDESFDEREDPLASDMDDDDDPPLVACPYCGAEMSEVAEVCPRCRRYLSAEDAPPARRPPWVVAGVVGCLVVVLIWVLLHG